MSSLDINLVLGRDNAGYVTYELPFTSVGYQALLAPNTASTLVVPANMTTAFFSYTDGIDVWVDIVNPAILPPNGTFTLTNADLKPTVRRVTAGETISMISNSSAYVKVSFYKVSQNVSF